MRQGHSDPGFVSEAKIELNDLIRTAYHHADMVMIGDGDHAKDDLFEHFGKPETAVALAESGVGHMFIEMPVQCQGQADRLASGEIKKDQFVKEMKEAGFGTSHRNTDEALGEVADIIKMANQAGIKVHFADFGNGYDEAMDADVEKHFFEKGEYPNQVTQETVNAADKKSWDVRLDDRKLAELINERVPEGEKAVVIYGAHHGSLYNDFEEHLSKGTSTVKIDVYPSESDFESSQRGVAELNDRTGTRLGEDAPDAVYMMPGFLSDGHAFTTGATSKEFSDDIQKNAKEFKPAESSDAPDIKSEEKHAPQAEGAEIAPMKPL